MVSRNPGRWPVAVFLMAVIALLTGPYLWILLPPGAEPIESDVVFVIAGSSDGRHEIAAGLVNDGVAENLVVSNPLGPEDEVGAAHCAGQDRPKAATRTLCLKPDPITTLGEVRTFGALMDAERWDSAVVVTSRTHVRRVLTLLEHCTELRVQVLPTDKVFWRGVPSQVIHELGGHIKFWFTDPC